MKVPIATAIVVGVVGTVIAYLYLGPLDSLGLLVPVTFLGAASFLGSGGTIKSLPASALSNVWGVLCGAVGYYLITQTTSTVLVSIIIGGMTAVFILGALSEALAFVPGSIIGFATTVLVSIATAASATSFSLSATDRSAFLVVLISLLVGNVYGLAGSLVVPRLVTATTPKTAKSSVSA